MSLDHKKVWQYIYMIEVEETHFENPLIEKEDTLAQQL
jgi:hypothetical protein